MENTTDTNTATDRATPTVAELRREYAAIRRRSLADTPADFDAAVRENLSDPETATPREWVRAAKLLRFRCRRCAGTGRYITYVENGVPKGPGGDCYRCNGKGAQDDADRRRNFGHDKNFVPLDVH